MTIVSFILACVLGSGFGYNANKPNDDLIGVSWHLQQIGNEEIPIEQRAPIFIQFEKSGKVTGKGDCNSFFSNYTTKKGVLEIKGIGSTEIACERQDLENRYFEWLATAQSYTIDGDGKLHIQSEKGEMVFVGHSLFLPD